MGRGAAQTQQLPIYETMANTTQQLGNSHLFLGGGQGNLVGWRVRVLYYSEVVLNLFSDVKLITFIKISIFWVKELKLCIFSGCV